MLCDWGITVCKFDFRCSLWIFAACAESDPLQHLKKQTFPQHTHTLQHIKSGSRTSSPEAVGTKTSFGQVCSLLYFSFFSSQLSLSLCELKYAVSRASNSLSAAVHRWDVCWRRCEEDAWGSTISEISSLSVSQELGIHVCTVAFYVLYLLRHLRISFRFFVSSQGHSWKLLSEH